MFTETQLENIEETIRTFADMTNRQLAKHLCTINPSAHGYSIKDMMDQYTRGDLLAMAVSDQLSN